MSEKDKVVWESLPLNILSRGGVTQELVDDIVKVIEKHNMFETSSPDPTMWVDSLGGIQTDAELEEWFESLKED